ncbi:EcsC family protein [Paracoccus sp. CPCC 101403]|uniref:EcsC family protein n=2 Tax=Paracoccus broussonetiae TaxID=3075834 RepID=A0ABU3EBM6_9RHOB|nr:EcsC family protein [Paracoccus sp. CPCC 101403]MDT1061633.1 EcsC family protein [Paracoccus sp. CPCC 101403]
MTEQSSISTRQSVLPPITDPTVHAELDRLARRYLNAGGMAMELMNAVGGKAENLLDRLPKPVRSRMDRITLGVLDRSFSAASRSRGVLADRGDWFNRMLSTTSGAVGGLAGIAGATLELPVTITLLLRAIMDIAAEHGFDPDSDLARREALHVFASAGPLADDEGADLGLVTARMTITGQTIQGLIAKVAPKLSASLAQKLAAQTVPILGAFAGAAINYNFTRYYQEVARVQFGLLRLSQETGLPREALVEALLLRMEQVRPGSTAKTARRQAAR